MNEPYVTMTGLSFAALFLLLPAAGALLWRPSRLAPGRIWLGLLLAVNAVLVAGGSIGLVIPAAGPAIFGIYILSPLLLNRTISRIVDPAPLAAGDALLVIPAALLAVLAYSGAWTWAFIMLHAAAVLSFVLCVPALRRSPSWARVLFGVFVVHWFFSAMAGLSRLLDVPGGQLLVVFSLLTLVLFALGAGVAGLRYAGMRLPSVATFSESAESLAISPSDATLCERLRSLFEDDAIHLDPDLTLDALALRATADPRDVSRVLNSVLGGGYHDVVRRYRVEQAQHLLRDRPEETILAILHDAGFNSKSAFHRAFSEQTGMTPSVWRRMHESRRPTS